MNVNGMLVLYHHSLHINAPTIMEHVEAFEQHSRFQVWNVNTELGFPEGLWDLQFQIMVLHYSLFGTGYYYLDDKFLSYIERSQASYKIAFFQDEYRYCQQRFSFLNRYMIDCVYTLVEPAYFKEVYQKYTNVPKLVYNLTGYVSDDLVALAQEITRPDEEREIDIGYRGRRLPFYMGQGAQEKHEIALKFRERAAGLDLKLDIETDERKRIYERAWYEFLANCRAVLGVEAGVSIFDIEDVVRVACEHLIAMNPKISFEEVSEKVLRDWEGNIPYRMVSPRHFEAAALRVCQILFEGEYSGIIQPMVHYIPLKKDFSNFSDVIRMFKDEKLRHRLTENAYCDLITSRQYSYQRFIEDFDRELLETGLEPGDFASNDIDTINALLERGKAYRQLRANMKAVLYSPFPGGEVVRFFVVPVLRMRRRLKQSGFANQE
jgi:hypothetical protein